MKKELDKDTQSGPDAGDIKTVCRDCAFAKYEGETQIGCKLGKLEKLRDLGETVVAAYDDTEKEFFIIQDRFCVFWRDPNWKDSEFARIPKDKRNDESLATRVRYEVRAKFLTIVYLDESSTISDLKKTVNSLKSGLLTPKKIAFCDNQSSVDTRELIKVAKSSGCLWGLEKIVENNANKQRCVDIVVKKAKSSENTYYSFFSAGESVPKNFHSDIDNAINDDLSKFLALYVEPEEEEGSVSEGFVGQIHIHKQIGGNARSSFLEKLTNVTGNQECQNLLIPLSEIVNLQ